MSLSKDLWTQNGDIAQEALNHPFVKGILAGTLPSEKFQVYLSQDIPFMQATVRVYSLILARIDETGLNNMFNLLSGAIDELNTQKARFTGGKSEILSAAQTYIDFMISNVAMGSIGNALAAVTPCVRLYAFLGQEIAAQANLQQHPYADWIQSYGDPFVETLALQLEELLDRYATTEVAATYRRAMRLEIEFFTAVI